MTTSNPDNEISPDLPTLFRARLLIDQGVSTAQEVSVICHETDPVTRMTIWAYVQVNVRYLLAIHPFVADLMVKTACGENMPETEYRRLNAYMRPPESVDLARKQQQTNAAYEEYKLAHDRK